MNTGAYHQYAVCRVVNALAAGQRRRQRHIELPRREDVYRMLLIAHLSITKVPHKTVTFHRRMLSMCLVKRNTTLVVELHHNVTAISIYYLVTIIGKREYIAYHNSLFKKAVATLRTKEVRFAFVYSVLVARKCACRRKDNVRTVNIKPFITEALGRREGIRVNHSAFIWHHLFLLTFKHKIRIAEMPHLVAVVGRHLHIDTLPVQRRKVHSYRRPVFPQNGIRVIMICVPTQSVARYKVCRIAVLIERIVVFIHNRKLEPRLHRRRVTRILQHRRIAQQQYLRLRRVHIKLVCNALRLSAYVPVAQSHRFKISRGHTAQLVAGTRVCSQCVVYHRVMRVYIIWSIVYHLLPLFRVIEPPVIRRRKARIYVPEVHTLVTSGTELKPRRIDASHKVVRKEHIVSFPIYQVRQVRHTLVCNYRIHILLVHTIVTHPLRRSAVVVPRQPARSISLQRHLYIRDRMETHIKPEATAVHRVSRHIIIKPYFPRR